MSPITAPVFFDRHTPATRWKLPLALLSWPLGFFITYCAACQPFSQLFYLLPLSMMLFFAGAALTSVVMLVKNWHSLKDVSLNEMYYDEMVFIFSPLLYAVVWSVALLITLYIFLHA